MPNDTLVKRVKNELPEFVEIVPPTEKAGGLYIRVRHALKTGECCGEPITLNEIKGIIGLASEDNVKNKICWLCKALSKANIKSTLSNIRDILSNAGAAARQAVKMGVAKTKEQIRAVCWLSKRLSMDTVVSLAEIAQKKRDPQRYYMRSLKIAYCRTM